MKTPVRTTFLLLFSLIAYFCLTKAFAASVLQIKGNRVLLDISDLPLREESQVFIVNSQGKKIGLIQIKQIKGGKAIADITKGRAEVGASLALPGGTASMAGPKSADGSNSENQKTKSPARKKISWGILAGAATNTFAMDIGPVGSRNRESASLKGMSYNLKGFADYDLGPSLTIRAASGLETLSASGTLANAYCDGSSTNCSVSINYLALEGSGHFNYLTGKTRGWVGLGYSYLISMSSTKTIPNLETSGSTNQLVLLGTGLDFRLSNGAFIPVVLEYGLYPGSSDVKVSAIFARVGYGFR